MADRRPERLEAVRGRLRAAELDGLLISSLPNIRYLTGFSGTSAVVVVTHGGAFLLSDFRYRAQAAQEVGDLARVLIEDGGVWERLFRLLGGQPGLSAIGYEAHVLTAGGAQRLAEGAANGRPWRFQPTTDIVESLRTVKSREEIDAIGAAGAVAARALAHAVPRVRAGQTENEIAALLEGALRALGSEGYPFPTIVASGPRAALPHARTSPRVVAPGEFLLIDFGAVVDGYCSDVTRTFVLGEADGRHREVYDAVREAQAAALSGLRAGMTGRQGDALARDVLAARGLGDAFGHSLGHGVGLEVHEAPRLARTVEDALPAGAVVTVEPGVYLEGWGGVRIEDDVVLEATGAVLLTEFPRELITLS